MVTARVQFAAQQAGAPYATRRRPRQSRARITSEALQEAFVQVLLDKGYGGVTVREVADVAGVSVGTFYQYVSSKRALAALAIHMRVKALGLGLKACAQAMAGQPLSAMLESLLDQQVSGMRAEARTWTALISLEREVSAPEAFREQYRRYVQAWAEALAQAGDAPAAPQLRLLARMTHVLCYGAVSQALLTEGLRVDWVELRREIGRAVRGYRQLLSEDAGACAPTAS